MYPGSECRGTIRGLGGLLTITIKRALQQIELHVLCHLGQLEVNLRYRNPW